MNDSQPQSTNDVNSNAVDRRTLAHVCPLMVFLICLTLPDIVAFAAPGVSGADQPWYVVASEQWVFPLQTLLTLGVLVYFRSQYNLRPITSLGTAVVVGTIGITLWILPGAVYRYSEMNESMLRYLGFAARTQGFNPSFIADHSQGLYWAAVLMRFVRLVIVVPLAEEIFWRGFLMRYVADPDGDFWNVPFGTFHWRSFVVVTAAFTLAHSSVDYLPAVIFGSLIYGLAVRTKSLMACVIAHGVANLLLGIYVMVFEQWGYW